VGAVVKVIVPYTNLRLETASALEEYGYERGHAMMMRDVSGSEDALWHLWKEAWAEREDFAFVEHDIVIHEGVIPSFEGCHEPWCTFAYPYAYGSGNPYHGTGCVRFRAQLMRDFPTLIDEIGELEGPKHPKRHWCSIDGFMQITLWRRNYRQHHHDPPVGHVDTSNSHGCLGTF
jgi:hypothetical protein